MDKGAPERQPDTLRQLRYLSDIIRFRLIHKQNRIDEKETEGESKKQIVYVVDSNVLYLYFDTINNASLTRVLPNIASRLDDRVDVSVAVITAEYIFSGELPGQNGYPLYMDQAHIGEFQGKISKVALKLRQNAVDLTPNQQRNLSRRIRSLRNRLHGAANDTSKLRELFDTQVPRLIRDFRLETVGQAILLKKLVKSDYVRPLRLAPFVDRNLFKLDPDVVREWETRLSAFARNEVSPSDADEMDLRDKNLKADAEAIARICALNQHAETTRRPVKYVLITASENIHSAAAFLVKEAGGELSRNFARTVTQFIPILNFREMPNFVERDQTTAGLAKAMDGLLQLEPQHPSESWVQMLVRLDVQTRQLQRDIRRISESAKSDNEKARRADAVKGAYLQAARDRFCAIGRHDFETILDNVFEVWRRIVANSIGLNVQLMLDHHGYYLASLAGTIGEVTKDVEVREELGKTYESRQIELSQSLTRAHLKMSIVFDLVDLHPNAARFACSYLGARPSALLSENVILELRKIVWAVAEGNLPNAEKMLRGLTNLKQIDNAQLALCAALISLQIGAWEYTKDFAKQAMNLVEETTPLFMGEAYWLRATARRNIVATQIRQLLAVIGYRGVRDLLKKAKQDMRNALKYFSSDGDLLGIARIRAELALLEATRLMIALVDEPADKGTAWGAARNVSLNREVFQEGIGRAIAAIGAAQTLDQSFGNGMMGEPLSVRISAVASMALIEMLLMGRLLELPVPVLSRSFMRSVADQVEHAIGHSGAPVFDAWPLKVDAYRRIFDLGDAMSHTDSMAKLRDIKIRFEERQSVASELELELLEQLKAVDDISANKLGVDSHS